MTNRKLSENFYERIEELSKSNLDYLILREKDLSDEELLNMAIKIKDILKKSSIKLYINTNIKVAEKVEAHGVQLSYKDFKSGVRYNGIMGVSVHNLDEALEAFSLGANYLIYGHVYETECKKGLKPRGLEELKDICNKVNIPVYGIGGINKENYMDVINVGAKGIAVMSCLFK